MTSLLFHTPSRRCPYRIHNGERGTLVGESASTSFVRRIGRHVHLYVLRLESGKIVFAYPDELFLEP